VSGKPVSIKSLKPGHFITIDDEPCRVVNVTISKPGKHGSTKARIEAMGLFDERKHELLAPASDEIEQPIIEKKKAQVISVSGNIVQLMDLEEYTTFEITIPEEFRGKMESGQEVSYWKISGRIMLREVK